MGELIMKPYFYLKIILDRLLAFIAIILFSPLFLLLAILIKLDSRGPVFFRQRRIGIQKKEFQILKFRTMKIEAPKNTPTHLLQNPKQYITKLGAFLRKYSLDELPQLINIFNGEMSVVGPRPALWNQYDLIAERDKYNSNAIRPGLTGWAQVNGRDELEIDVKAQFDGEYVQKMSLLFDIKIVWKTFANIFNGKGIVEGVTHKKTNIGV
ncbi:sugar transferase [Ruminiclostridium cellobioparum]|jgi:O-antigen biosynthesis protein WbqP|uniref:sugar transferase n=1 Tax=Ruminiclostridium cellobioparum TaxID=29355 RepID=UPI0028B02972|nr:sugar transferase [Ruminiclostridium cellobioparum]